LTDNAIQTVSNLT